MDKIAKVISNKDMGVEIELSREKIGCLLWMDDVVLVTSDRKENVMQSMLDIVEDVAKRYHIKFGKDN